jgi:hypothetical protein
MDIEQFGGLGYLEVTAASRPYEEFETADFGNKLLKETSLLQFSRPQTVLRLKKFGRRTIE